MLRCRSACLALGLFLASPAHAQTTFDVIVSGGRIFDGTGNPWFTGDIGIQGDNTITAVGSLSPDSARVHIDASGLTAAPGFIDIHSHALGGLFAQPQAENLIRQGVTTVMDGNDGSSPLPLPPFWQKLNPVRIGVNLGLYVGHGTLRRTVVGLENRVATPDETGKMAALARQAMRDGAFGLPTGLYYVPGNYARVEEIVAIARVVGELGGMHISHVRDESAGILDSLRETIRIGEEGKLPTQLSHHKVMGMKNWGLSRETLQLVTEARARGVDVTIDQYPYSASSTGTAAFFPQWPLAGGNQALMERLQNPEQRASIKAAIVRNIIENRGGEDPKNVVLASCSFDKTLSGKSLADLGEGLEGAAEAAIDLQKKGGCSAVYHAIAEEDISRIITYPWTMVASDGGIPAFGVDVPHPRNYGRFPRVLALYVRAQHLLTLEEAVRRMSGFPAQRLKIYDRGLLRPGMKADVAVFDAAQVADRADFQKPHQYAVGVRTVVVNGTPVLLNGEMTEKPPGRALYGPANGIR